MSVLCPPHPVALGTHQGLWWPVRCSWLEASPAASFLLQMPLEKQFLLLFFQRQQAGRQAGSLLLPSSAREGSGVLLVWIRTEREQPALLLSLPQRAREGAIPGDTESSTVSARGTKTSR